VLRTVFIALGIAMLVVAIAWRARERRRRSNGIEAALRSPDPFTRTRALREIASVGLRPWATMLLGRTLEVGDGVEADELVWLIGACQWEPADEPAIVQLRLWASHRLERVSASPEPVAVAAVTPVAVETLDLGPPAPVAGPVMPEPEIVEPEIVEPEIVEPAPVPVLETVPAVVLAPRDRPEIVDEIEAIVGARVLAVRFVPLAGATS
jgi:hypothetical protein